MTRTTTLTALILAAAVTACGQDPASSAEEEGAVSESEARLAATLETAADSMMQARGGRPNPLLRRFVEAVRASGDSVAMALLDESRALLDSARAAREAGDRDAARGHLEASREALCDAVVMVLPDAYEETGALVDTIVTRITARLGDAEAPRIRRALAIVDSLRTEASAAAASDEGHALSLNLRALTMLRQLREQVSRPGGPGAPGIDGEPGMGPYGPGRPGGGRPGRPGGGNRP